MNQEKLKKMAESVRTGGKGSVRRKKKAIHKTTTTDDKRLQNTLKRLSCNNIPGIEEVNLFKENGTVIHFTNPKVQASIAANTYVISGHAETKKLQDLLPGIINQLGPSDLEMLKKAHPGGGGGGKASETIDEEDDDDMPELVDSFECARAQPGAGSLPTLCQQLPARAGWWAGAHGGVRGRDLRIRCPAALARRPGLRSRLRAALLLRYPPPASPRAGRRPTSRRPERLDACLWGAARDSMRRQRQRAGAGPGGEAHSTRAVALPHSTMTSMLCIQAAVLRLFGQGLSGGRRPLPCAPGTASKLCGSAEKKGGRVAAQFLSYTR